jgi:hypothetical protein
LRPRFLSPDQYHFLQGRVRVLLSAFGRLHRAAVADDQLRRQFGLTPEEDELVRLEPRFPWPYPTSRLDAFFVSETELKFTEYNSETPAGAGYGDALAEAFLGMPALREFMKRYQVYPLPTRPPVLHVLVDSYQQWAGRRELPRIAILDWREVPTYSEFEIFHRYFRSQGLECVIADPREVEYRDRKLWAGGLHVTLIYKRVLIGELLERGGLNHPVVRAVRDGAVCMVNPFACKLLYKKASLAVLSDEQNSGLFTPDERQAIADHIPWTRIVAERLTTFDGRAVDLIPFVLSNRQQLVLKPSDAYGGAGITLGWTVEQAEWEDAVRSALARPTIVQQRVNLPHEPYPSFVDGRLQWIDRLQDTAPFVWYGHYMDGCLTRISTAALLNVTAGGGSTVPTFVVEER